MQGTGKGGGGAKGRFPSYTMTVKMGSFFIICDDGSKWDRFPSYAMTVKTMTLAYSRSLVPWNGQASGLFIVCMLFLVAMISILFFSTC